ncbi:hypothetical protein CPT_Moogle92 [Citrobacter phage Moogle]|uniref:Uncharacterized protein n=2 Tax=Mooglevirus moogle TaxID=1985304 RepID=A0A0A0RQA1_9CAUD|nr:hypothetical protein CPT_Moogle92 [Citrobacter phage Moogle]AIW03829.1 hypothetical protein CPT_Moogle92 [Citrobacter phage Moogle]ARB06588.1 hypothetical protein CPT_Mijalis093 [Citrobacter phage Mijalis]
MKLWADDVGTFKYTRSGMKVRIYGSKLITYGDKVVTKFIVEVIERSPIMMANKGFFTNELYNVDDNGLFFSLGESSLDIISEHPLTREQLSGYYKTLLEKQKEVHNREAIYHNDQCIKLLDKIEKAERGYYE